MSARPVGVCFAVVGVVSDAATGEPIAEAPHVRPYGYDAQALADARALAAERGWVIVSAQRVRR